MILGHTSYLLNWCLHLTTSSSPQPRWSYAHQCFEKQLFQARAVLSVQGKQQKKKKNLGGQLKLDQERGYSKETRLKWFSSLVLPGLWQAHEFPRNKTAILLVTHRAHQGAKNTHEFHWRRNTLIQEEGIIRQVVLTDLKCWCSRKQLNRKQNRGQGAMKVEGFIKSQKEVLRGVACFMVIDLLD